MSDVKDVMRQLAEARPGHLDPGAPVEPHTRNAELPRIMAAARPSRAPGKARRPMWGLGLVGLAAAVLAVAMAVTGTDGPAPRSSGGGTAAPAVRGGTSAPAVREVTINARTALLAAAHGAQRQPQRTGRYWHVRTLFGTLEQVGPAGGRYAVLHRYQHDAWNPRSPDEEGWFRSEELGARPATTADEAAWRADGSPTAWVTGPKPKAGGGKPPNTRVPDLEMNPKDSAFAHSTGRASDAPDELNVTQDELERAAADPAELRALLLAHPLGEAHDGENTDAELFETAAGILMTKPLPPAKRAAIYRLLAGIDGVTATDGVKDAAGRTGTALKMRQRYPNGSVEIHFIVDRATGAGLAKEIHYLKGEGDRAWMKPGTRWYYEVVTSQWVDVLPDMPRGPRTGGGGP
ncbi:hypothetical protein SAMN04489712_12419 [Thermomonospora echinospora]|uniref:CU044_5270 family protein n=1 Tax=Thermomonospora echinospora TaxID=1992 RepID=A0A1H6DWT3_9ACTN|nr:CU044_5270 family protein [Thermomonospora echinospora]SEG89659.1 hypothetical protein SAMN04489712_12419 [Thermomonospora echinospora]